MTIQKQFATIYCAGLMVCGAAAANAETVTSTVKSFDASQQVLVLDDGRSFTVQAGLDTSSIEPGMTVTLNVEQIGNAEIVTEISTN